MNAVTQAELDRQVYGLYDNSTARYNEAAAKLAWDRTLAHFKKYLV
jgi:carboxymethylenebutenolidase